MACRCCQCGSCCSNMGNVHTVIEERGNYTFVVYNAYSGDVKEVRVDPDKIALFEDASSIAELPDACPFLRFETPRDSPAPSHGNVAFDGKKGKAWCTVPDTSRDLPRLLLLASSHPRSTGQKSRARDVPNNVPPGHRRTRPALGGGAADIERALRHGMG